MVFKKIVRGIIGLFHQMDDWSAKKEEKTYHIEKAPDEEKVDEIHSVWDYLNFRPNTQAFHLASVLGFDEWVDMNEIRRRIKEIFGAEYKNERSLYPYLKTLTDMGLIESSSIGGRMQWRKHDLLIKVSDKNEKTMKAAMVEAQTAKKRKILDNRQEQEEESSREQ